MNIAAHALVEQQQSGELNLEKREENNPDYFSSRIT